MNISKRQTNFMYPVMAASLVILPLAAMSMPGEQDIKLSQPSLQINVGRKAKPGISVKAKNMALMRILDDLAEKTGTLIHYSKLSDAHINADCQGKNIDEVMTCLVSKQFSLVAKPAEKNKPAEFWLVGDCASLCAANIAENQQHETDNAMSEDRQYHVNRLLEQYRNSKDLSLRAEALNNLMAVGSADNLDLRDVFEDALADQDPVIRAQAVNSLTYLDKDNATEYLNRALFDKDVSVRMNAVDKADGNRNLLEQAASDSDPGIRSFAEAKLAQLISREQRYPKK